jgi:CHAT domain-containing protein
MDSLGKRLLAPVARQLPETIYFLPIGRTQGLPLDALRWNGAFLGATHRVRNLLSLDALGAEASNVESGDLQRFFLAGNQLSDAGDFGISKPTPREIRTITNLFVGPGLHIVQGSALQWDEFQVQDFTSAGVIHLAMPGNIDLRDPAQSRLLLSDNIDEVEHEFLLPLDIGQKSLSARLVVMSGTDFIGTSPSAFDANTQFVAEFLQAGAGSVIASLWSVGDAAAAEFMLRFYRRLKTHPNASEALFEVKKSYLETDGNTADASWAAFQLFVD